MQGQWGAPGPSNYTNPSSSANAQGLNENGPGEGMGDIDYTLMYQADDGSAGRDQENFNWRYPAMQE